MAFKISRTGRNEQRRWNSKKCFQRYEYIFIWIYCMFNLIYMNILYVLKNIYYLFHNMPAICSIYTKKVPVEVCLKFLSFFLTQKIKRSCHCLVWLWIWRDYSPARKHAIGWNSRLETLPKIITSKNSWKWRSSFRKWYNMWQSRNISKEKGWLAAWEPE